LVLKKILPKFHSIIQVSCWRTWYFLSKKKDKFLEMTIYYCELNKVSVKNCYPLPLIHRLFDQLGQTKIYIKIDPWEAYNLLRIKKRTNGGMHEFLDKFVVYYLNNILIYFKNIEGYKKMRSVCYKNYEMLGYMQN